MEDISAYDPGEAPDPTAWLSLGEWDRMALIDKWHQEAGEELPNRHLHAVVHCVVENQIAAATPAAAVEAMTRLRTEGLTRHDAIHAIGSVLARHLHSIVRSAGATKDSGAAYQADLQALTAQSWRALAKD